MNLPNVLLSGIVGSTAYGLAHAGSDIDHLGVFAAPTAALHGLTPPVESYVTTDPDVTLHEAAKWCRLALGCNPTVMELVYLPGELYAAMTPLGMDLIRIRSAFLSARAVRNAYLGYATQQFRKLQARGGGHPRGAKHARHLYRLLLQAEELHTTGTLTLRLADPEKVREIGERIAEKPDRALPLMRLAEAHLDRPGVLPEVPDPAVVEAWLLRVREAFYTPAQAPVPG